MEDKKGVKYIRHEGKLIGLCVRADHMWDRTEFLSEDAMPQQIGLLKYDGGKVKAHAHNEIPRTVNTTTEVLFCVSGRIRYTFYDPVDQWREIDSVELTDGDVLCLYGAGHGAKVIEPTRLIEIKQGPYLGMKDKFFMSEDRNTGG